MADACTAGVSSASIMHEQQLMNLCLLTACVYVWIAQARAHSDSSRMQMSNLVIAKILVLRACQQHFGCTSLPAPMHAPRTQLHAVGSAVQGNSCRVCVTSARPTTIWKFREINHMTFHNMFCMGLSSVSINDGDDNCDDASSN